jgi:GTP cyclohydrolase I
MGKYFDDNDTNGGEPVNARLAELYREILIEIGEDPDRPGLLDTPRRLAESMEFLTRGYRQTVEDVVGDAVFEEDIDEMIILKDIGVYSLCEHHMLPMHGHAHIAYIPKGRIIGLSKLGRIVDVFARRLQVQERMTNQIAHAIQQVLKPKGVGVIIEAQHFCMMMRGVQKQNSLTVTSCMLGGFKTRSKTRSEFLELVYGSNARR